MYMKMIPKIHFSIDDVLGCLLWLEENRKSTIFDSHVFFLAKQIWDRYGIMTTCNVFYENERGCLDDVSGRYRKELILNKYIMFSFHGRNSECNYRTASYDQAKSDYNVIIDNIARIAGEDSISTIVRTHLFAGNKDAVRAWRDCGVKVLLTADDNRQSYDLTKQEEMQCKQNVYFNHSTGLSYIATDIRVENYLEKSIDIECLNNKPVILFTHEWLLNNSDVIATLFRILDSL